ncbi:MAG: DUF4159 domain-containing protein [Spirochaetota bacterium]
MKTHFFAASRLRVSLVGCSLRYIVIGAAVSALLAAQPGSDFTFAVLKYGGGGDWYEGTVGVRNLMQLLSRSAAIVPANDPVIAAPLDPGLYMHPLVFMNGHGNISFTKDEVRALRRYIEAGGFIFANDDYGMDASFRREMKRIIPESDLVELPRSHRIYHVRYDFPAGLPKIHVHEGGAPKGYGLFLRGRLVVFYAYDADIADGWADPEVHKDAEAKRLEGLRMGVNVILYALEN